MTLRVWAEGWFVDVQDDDINIYFIIIFWNIWLARNQMAWNNILVDLSAVVFKLRFSNEATKQLYVGVSNSDCTVQLCKGWNR